MGFASAMAWTLVIAVALVTAVLFWSQKQLGALRGGRQVTSATSPVAAAPRTSGGALGSARLARGRARSCSRSSSTRWSGCSAPRSSRARTSSPASTCCRPSRSWANFSGLADGISGISIGSFFTNSLMLRGPSVVGVVISSSLTAYAFAKIRFAGRNLLFTLMIGTLLLPYHVLLIPQYVLFRKLELHRHLRAAAARASSWPRRRSSSS